MASISSRPQHLKGRFRDYASNRCSGIIENWKLHSWVTFRDYNSPNEDWSAGTNCIFCSRSKHSISAQSSSPKDILNLDRHICYYKCIFYQYLEVLHAFIIDCVVISTVAQPNTKLIYHIEIAITDIRLMKCHLIFMIRITLLATQCFMLVRDLDNCWKARWWMFAIRSGKLQNRIITGA